MMLVSSSMPSIIVRSRVQLARIESARLLGGPLIAKLPLWIPRPQDGAGGRPRGRIEAREGQGARVLPFRAITPREATDPLDDARHHGVGADDQEGVCGPVDAARSAAAGVG